MWQKRRQRASAKGYHLASIFCIEEERTLTADWMVRFENQFYQLQPLRKAQVGKGKVLIRLYLNGELHFCYQQRDLAYVLLPERPTPKTVNKVKNENRRARASTGPYIPPASHAWRIFQFGKGRLGLAEPKATLDQKLNSEGFSK